MPALKAKTTATDALVVLSTIALTSFIVATLYFARGLLIPLALSALLTFLLSPLVTRIERWVGRIAAVLLVVALIFTGFGAAGWMLTRQLVDLATKLPEYKGNIIAKMHAFETPKGGVFTKLSETVEELKNELPGGTAQPAPTITQEVGKPETAVSSPPRPPPPAVPVQMIETSNASPFELVKLIIAPLLGPLGTGALVLLLIICMLLQREDLRSRLIRLIGQGRISATTRAMDDAGARVSRYLLMQLVVNVTYGIPVAIGLYFIGVPNAVLWGAFAVVLRFIPYIGPWIAAAFPITLARAKELVERIEHTHRYRVRGSGLRVISGALCLRQCVLRPVLAGLAQPGAPPAPPAGATRLDQWQLLVQGALHGLLSEVGLAA